MKKTWIVILLTLLTGCTTVSSESDVPDKDPIARAAFEKSVQSESAPSPAPPLETQPKLSKAQEIRLALEAEEIIPGMSMDDVLSVWGRPTHVEVAGEVRFKNQKWTYSDRSSHYLGPSTSRIVYFEEGKVVGWETD